jgi:membrane-bound lytic murein transglycosylase D
MRPNRVAMACVRACVLGALATPAWAQTAPMDETAAAPAGTAAAQVDQTLAAGAQTMQGPPAQAPAPATEAAAVSRPGTHEPSTNEPGGIETGAIESGAIEPEPIGPEPAASPAAAGPAPKAGDASPEVDGAGERATRGLDIYESFRAGLAEPECGNAQARWSRHFAQAPERLGNPDSDTLALFGHVVGALREAQLPTEFALIPFIESGYAPAARSKAGPAGLWQFIGITARNHGLRIEPGYDARLSPADSTRAAVRYLKTLYGMFGGNWRLTAMAYNAGEYRVLKGLRRSGGNAVDATPGSIPGLAPITYAYVEKLHALACLLEQAGDEPRWRAGLDQPVNPLQVQSLEAASLDAWAASNGHDAATLRRLNPDLAGRWPSRGTPLALVPQSPGARSPGSAVTATPDKTQADADAGARTHSVRRGDSAWGIARRYGMSTRRLQELNGLEDSSVLRPGMVLRVE